ncbi:hypothetical protein DEU56DRAFT_908388 [Suillus clintonianus]|uniref:uncharacterized protein n=1 Tax=Suillus clintonianus TaxID=1904413 RepID=UPI001B87D49E|nr:uncharacterized protein DEU56DRAFT_908388 [Suillus clintonianus]KAG2151544.1 hypothetical protein DEU56DRAFT_908388 [Suillus clintonianus]
MHLLLRDQLWDLGADSFQAPAQQNNNAPANNVQEEGWLEVGKCNRTVLTRSTKTTDSPITRIFGGKFRSTLRVPHQKDSVVFEDWRSLRLDIQRDTIHTIKDALTHISIPQSVQVTSVTRPGATLDATQQVHIDSLPPILILALVLLPTATVNCLQGHSHSVAFVNEVTTMYRHMDTSHWFLGPRMTYTSGVILDANKGTSLENSKDLSMSRYYTIAAILVQ